MLSEDLTTTLRARSADIETSGSSILMNLERRIATSRRHRRIAATGAVVALVAGTILGVAVATNDASRGQPTPALAGATKVPCATPTREVPGYLDWPCPAVTLTPYDRAAIHHLRTFTALMPGVSSPARVPDGSDAESPSDVAIRVLAMGPLPNSRPGSTVVHAEVWFLDGTGPASIVTSYGFHASEEPQWTLPHVVHDWVPAGDGTRNGLAGNPIIFLDAPPSIELPRLPDECQRLADTKPNERHGGYLAACTDTVVARADVANIRMIGPHGQLGALNPVTDGLAGLDSTRTHRPNWRIQALDADGNIIGSVPFAVR